MDETKKDSLAIIKNAKAVVKPLVIKPRITEQLADSFYTKDILKNMTKIEIIDLALEKYGIELSIRRKKEEIIEEFLKVTE